MKSLEALRLLDYNQKEKKLVWNGTVNDLEKFLIEFLDEELGDGGLTSNTSAKCAVFKTVHVSINFYPTTRTLQIQGKGGKDLKILLIDLLVKNNEYEDDNSVIHQSPESEQDPCTNEDDLVEELRELESFIDSAIETVETDKEQARSPSKDGIKDEIKQVWEAIEVINSKIVALELITCKDEAVVPMTTGPTKPPKDLIAFDNLLRDNELLKSKLSEAETEIRRIKKENLSLITALKLPNTNYLELINKTVDSNESSSQVPGEWTLVTNQVRTSLENYDPMEIYNPFEALQDLQEQTTENTCENQTRNNSPSDRTILADQIEDYRLQQRNKYQQENQRTEDEYIEDMNENKLLEAQIDDYRSQQRNRFKQDHKQAEHLNVSQPKIDQDKSNGSCQRKSSSGKVYLIGDSIIKNVDPQKLEKVYDGVVEKKCLRGACIEDIHRKIGDLLNSESGINKETRLIIHAGSNNLTKEHENELIYKMRTFIDDTKAKVKTLAISSVTPRDDIQPEKIEAFNSGLRELCEKKDVMFLDNNNVESTHLNRSRIHLNRKGDSVLGRNLCRYLRNPDHPVPMGFQKTKSNHRPRHHSQTVQDTAWVNYLRLVRTVTSQQ